MIGALLFGASLMLLVFSVNGAVHARKVAQALREKEERET